MISLSIEQIAPELHEHGFWTPLRCIYLLAILNVCSNKRITKKHLPKITVAINNLFDEFADGRRGSIHFLPQEHKYGCNEIIDKLSEYGWHCSYYKIKQKPFRPSLLPEHKEQLEELEKANEIRRNFWSGKLDIQRYASRVFFKELIACTGIPYETLKRTDICSDHNGYIHVPVNEDSNLYLNIPISARTYLLQRWCIENNAFANLSEYSSDIESLKYQSFLNGTESLVLAQFQRDNLPTPLPYPDEHNPIVFRYLKSDLKRVNGFDDITSVIPRSRSDVHAITDDDRISPELLNTAKDIESVLPWSQACITTLRRIRAQLRKCLIDENGVFKNDRINSNTVEQILENAETDAINQALIFACENAENKGDRIKIDSAHLNLQSSETALHLAIHRIRHHLIDEGNTYDTCMKEISSIFEGGFLIYPASSDLRNWDEEDLEILINEYILSRQNRNKLQDSTKDQILETLRRVLLYARNKLKLFENLNIPNNPHSKITTTKRNHPLGAKEFDCFINSLHNSITLKVIYYLAFYAGLRSGEIAALTLGDLVCENDHELWIYVKEGKTPSARRAIPLHLLAAPNVIQEIVAYSTEIKQAAHLYKSRLDSTSKSKFRINNTKFIQEVFYSLKSEQLVYSADLANGKKPASMIMMALAKLHEIIGTGADLHLLRHSFASNLFLRWYCTKHPELIPNLTDEGHWLYTTSGLDQLKKFFGRSGNEEKNTDMIHMIKLMGHKSTDTFFEVYVHSFEAVAQHELMRINSKTDDLILPGKLISELVPGMKSRASQAKLKSKSAKDLVHYLYISSDGIKPSRASKRSIAEPS